MSYCFTGPRLGTVYHQCFCVLRGCSAFCLARGGNSRLPTNTYGSRSMSATLQIVSPNYRYTRSTSHSRTGACSRLLGRYGLRLAALANSAMLQRYLCLGLITIYRFLLDDLCLPGRILNGLQCSRNLKSASQGSARRTMGSRDPFTAYRAESCYRALNADRGRGFRRRRCGGTRSRQVTGVCDHMLVITSRRDGRAHRLLLTVSKLCSPLYTRHHPSRMAIVLRNSAGTGQRLVTETPSMPDVRLGNVAQHPNAVSIIVLCGSDGTTRKPPMKAANCRRDFAVAQMRFIVHCISTSTCILLTMECIVHEFSPLSPFVC